MTEQGIIAPVTAPTPWDSSLVAVPKKNSMLRLCLDPEDLNKAVQREHYPLPTIEDVARRLQGAKVFTKLDVRSSFWHITLDSPSSYLTTFNTPFGRFRWRRMPFGIRSAPDARMLLRLQRYNLVIQCKRGKEMYQADTLSRVPYLTSALVSS